MRGLSNTLAGLIILTFVLVAVLPLIVDIINSSTHLSIRAAELAAAKARSLTPSLNITLDPKLTTDTVKVYRVENMAANEEKIAVLVVEDSLNKTYLVKARNCLTGCAAGTATVSVQPLSFFRLGNETIILLPRGSMIVEIANGRLLGIYTAAGGYASPKGGASVVEVQIAKYAEYAKVAGGVETNYFDLSKYNDLSDLINDPNVALVSDPSQSTTDPSILWSNMLQSVCYYDGELKEGGFRLVNGLNQTRFRGLVFFNIQPVASSFIVGGRDTSYSSPEFRAGIFLHAYSLAPFNPTLPGLVAGTDYDGSWFAIFNLGGHIYSEMSSGSISTNLNELRNLLETHMYYGYSSITGLWRGIEKDSFQMEVWFDTGGWGLIAVGTIRDTGGNEYNAVVYCAPTDAEAAVDAGSGSLALTFTHCVIAATTDGSLFYLSSDNDINSVTVYLQREGYNETGDNVYSGHYPYASVHIDGVLTKLAILHGSDTSQYARPFKLKAYGVTAPGLIKIYDGARHKERAGAKAFGHYFYSGNPRGNIAAIHALEILGLRDVNVTAFYFSPGDTSGLEAYTAFLDTDGNGLVEINFITEEYDVGGPDSWDDLLAYYPYTNIPDIYVPMGCLDKSLKPLYLKFMGDYAVNGGNIAEVSIQIRYQFHDNAGPDVDDVEDPMQFLMGFRLVDSNGTAYSTSDYIYQQLMILEDTWPPSTHWVSDSVFLLVPDRNETYYVVFALNDPYGWDSPDNDMDFTLAVEWLGMWYLYRNQG